jgi:hypothetical protein
MGGSLQPGQISTIAERGPELVTFPGGGAQLFDRPQLVKFDKFAMVHNAADTRRMLASQPNYLTEMTPPSPMMAAPVATHPVTQSYRSEEMRALTKATELLGRAVAEGRTVQFVYPAGHEANPQKDWLEWSHAQLISQYRG